MGIFGEAIHGHIGFFKTEVYGAAIRGGQLVRAQGLTEQDIINVILSSAGIGPNDSENHIIMLEPEGRGVSWSLRVAPQGDSKVSDGCSHLAYWQSELSVFRDLDALIYFPFITDGAEFTYLLQKGEQFNLSRWPSCMQNVSIKKAYQRQLLGAQIPFSQSLLKKVVCYILGKLDTNARKYLYILVPQGVPYQAYCEEIIFRILSAIPIGLRKGITIATNPDQKNEDSFGIIFQHEANPARHGCDLSFHRNGNYSFLNDYYLSKNIEKLIDLFVEDPGMAEICYREMEFPIFGESLPGNMTPYDSYYGISQLHVNKNRPEYLEDCNTLLEQTQGNPRQRMLVENAIRTEIGSEDSCLAFIERDKGYISSKEITDINDYLRGRRYIIEYLNTIGIDFESVFLYKKLKEICHQKNRNTAEEIYREIVIMVPGLTEVEQKKKEICSKIAREAAWREFEVSLPPFMIELPTNKEGKPYYTLEIIQALLEARNSESGWGVADAFNHYKKITEINTVTPPANIYMWYRRMKRLKALYSIFEIEKGRDINKIISRATINSIADVFEYSNDDKYVKDSAEAGSALDCVQRIYELPEKIAIKETTAIDLEKSLIEIHELCTHVYRLRAETENRRSYEKALFGLMLEYMKNCSEPNRYRSALEVAQTEITTTDIKEAYLYKVNEFAALQIANERVPDSAKTEIYNAVKIINLHRVLQDSYEAWVSSKLKEGASNAETLEKLYSSVYKPSYGLVAEYEAWKHDYREKCEIEEIVMTSKTYVRYLQAVIKRRTSADDPENQNLRENFWNRLIHEERDISAFLGAVYYIKNCEPTEFLLSHDDEARKILDELRCLIGRMGKHMGLLLSEEESLQELYQKVLIFSSLVDHDVSWIPLYSLKDFDDLQNLGKVSDSEGRVATAKSFDLNAVIEVLSLLIEIQNQLYKKEEEDIIIFKLDKEEYIEILRFFEKAGVFSNKRGLEKVFAAIGVRKEEKKEDSRNDGNGLLKYLPYIVCGAAAVLLAALIISIILSHKTSDNNSAITTITPIAESIAISDSSDSDTTSIVANHSRDVIESTAATESVSALDESVSAEPTAEVTPEAVETPNPAETTPVDDVHNTVPGEVVFENGRLISNRVPDENNKAIRTEEGYDVNNDGQTDLFPVYDSKLRGFGFRQGEVVDIGVIRDSNTGNIIGYDTNQDGLPDSQPVKGNDDEKNGVDLDGDGTLEIGFDLDGDGRCEIDFSC